MRRQARRAAAGLVLAVLAVLPSGAALAVPAVTPHRAVYELKLARAADAGQISQAEGKLEFEWADACTGWTVSQRTHVRLISTDGRVLEFGWTLSALEAKDGSLYRFFIRRLNPGEPSEDVKGAARIATPGGAGLAVYETPHESEMALPAGTLFPAAHSLLLLEAAAQGQASFGRIVFDGSGDEGIFFVNAAVTEAVPADTDVPLDTPVLKNQPSWRINLAYFDLDETIAEPQHEQALRLYANGVVDDLILDYGDFALRARLKSLDPVIGGC